MNFAYTQLSLWSIYSALALQQQQGTSLHWHPPALLQKTQPCEMLWSTACTLMCLVAKNSLFPNPLSSILGQQFPRARATKEMCQRQTRRSPWVVLISHLLTSVYCGNCMSSSSSPTSLCNAHYDFHPIFSIFLSIFYMSRCHFSV